MSLNTNELKIHIFSWWGEKWNRQIFLMTTGTRFTYYELCQYGYTGYVLNITDVCECFRESAYVYGYLFMSLDAEMFYMCSYVLTKVCGWLRMHAGVCVCMRVFACVCGCSIIWKRPKNHRTTLKRSVVHVVACVCTQMVAYTRGCLRIYASACVCILYVYIIYGCNEMHKCSCMCSWMLETTYICMRVFAYACGCLRVYVCATVFEKSQEPHKTLTRRVAIHLHSIKLVCHF